jgi:hypothetical protein
MDTVESLHAQGITPAVTTIRYRSDQPFHDVEEACGFWEEYLGLAPGAERWFLRGFLAERLSRESGGWGRPLRQARLGHRLARRAVDAARGKPWLAGGPTTRLFPWSRVDRHRELVGWGADAPRVEQLPH